jgi:peroxiredoxin (alkyl hydroperoxide reductase subunit C)
MIKVGDTIPEATLVAATPEGPREMTTAELFGGHKVVLFAVPGAFTPTCSAKHMPGFLNNFDALKAKGVDQIACVAVNDPFVMGAWAKDQDVGDRVLMLSDGMAHFTKSLGLELDLSTRGLGIRSSRYAMVVEDGTVTVLNVEEPGGFEVSSAEAVLEAL